MSVSELQKAGITNKLNELLCLGGYPRIYRDNLDPFKARNNCIETYVERDLRQLLEVKDLHLFQKFLNLCAGRIGQVLNKESLSNDVGISSKTVSHWISILEASYIRPLSKPHLLVKMTIFGIFIPQFLAYIFGYDREIGG